MFYERILPTRRGSNPQPPDHQSDAHPTVPPRATPAMIISYYENELDNLGKYLNCMFPVSSS